MAANVGNVKEGRAVAEKARVGHPPDRRRDLIAGSSCMSHTNGIMTVAPLTDACYPCFILLHG